MWGKKTNFLKKFSETWKLELRKWRNKKKNKVEASSILNSLQFKQNSKIYSKWSTEVILKSNKLSIQNRYTALQGTEHIVGRGRTGAFLSRLCTCHCARTFVTIRWLSCQCGSAGYIRDGGINNCSGGRADTDCIRSVDGLACIIDAACCPQGKSGDVCDYIICF